MPDRAHEKTNKKRAEYSLEEVALYNLSLFADHVWCEEEVDFHRAACQRTWVRYNRMKEACSRTSVLDLLAQVRLEQKKTVRDTIPFSHLAQYGNYEYNEGAEKNYVPEATVAALQPLPSDLSVHRPLSRRPHLFTSFDLSTLQMETETLTCSGTMASKSFEDRLGQCVDCKSRMTFTILTKQRHQLTENGTEVNDRESHDVLLVCLFSQEQDRAMLMASYADQLEYTAGYHDDPSLGRAEDPPLGNFGRICGPFDPIKFSGLAKEILKVEEKKTSDSWEPQAAAMNNVWRDNCISWANWLLCIYPEFLQNLCNRDEISKNMPPPDQTLDMAVDYLEILNRPISLIDVQQFLQPRLQSLSRYRQGLKRLYEQIASQEVRNLWMTDSEQAMNVTLSGPSSSDSGAPTPPVKLESEIYIGLSASDESALSAREVSFSQLTMVSVPHRHRPMTKPRESGHKSKSSRRRGSDGKRGDVKRHSGSTPAIASRKELLSSKPSNKVPMVKVPLGASSLGASQGRGSVPTTPRTPSAPILKELRAEDFPTLSEAAIMNFRQPASSGGQSVTPTRHTSPQAKSRSIAAVLLERPDQPAQANSSSPSDWTNFVDTPMQRSIHSKSDTDLHRSTSQGSNPQSSPISESSGGLHSESDSDIQLQESFQRCEEDACFLLRSTASGQSSSSEDSCLTSALLSSDDAHMNIHAPSFRPRGKNPQKQQLTRHLLSLFHAPQSTHQASSETPNTAKPQPAEQPSVSPLPTSSGLHRIQPKAQHQHSQQPRPETKQRSSTTTTVYPGASRQFAWQPLNQPLQPVPLQPSVTGSASASGFYGARRIPLTFQQQPQQWRPTFPPLAQGSMLQPSISQMLSGQPSAPSCKPPPGFETIYTIGDGSNSHPVSAHPSRQAQPPPQLALPPSVGSMVPQPPHRFFPATTSVAQQHAHGYTTTNASTTVGYFPQAYSNQQDMFPYHSSTGMPSVLQSQSAQQQLPTSTETTSARTLVAAAAAMLSPRQGPGITSSNMDHIRSTFGSGLLPVPDGGAAYLMNVHQQLLYPLAFPNQFVPSCRYLVPPPVRMPAPQQFLPPQLLPPQPQPNCFTPGTTGSDLSFAWTRFDPSQSSVLPGYTANSLFPNQFSQISGGGTTTTTSNGASGVQFLQPDGIVNSQQQNRALGLYLAGLSSYSDGGGGMGSMRDEGASCGRGTFWRHHYPQSQATSNLQVQQQFLIQRAPTLNQPEAGSNAGSMTDDGVRKGRSRKREPSNLVQLVGLADLVALGGKRRDRNKRMRSHQPQSQQTRLVRGTVDAAAGSMFAPPQEGGSQAPSHETPSEDSEEQSVTQNEESSEDWAADAQTTDVDDVGEGADGIMNLECATKRFAEESSEPALDIMLTAAYDAEHSILLSDLRAKKRRRSLNTSGSSRSSEADNAFDERGASKMPLPLTSTGTNQRQSRPRYRSYKECLQTTVKAPSSQSTADSPYDDINYSTFDSFKVAADKGRSDVGSSVGLDTIELGSTTDLSLAILQAEAASSSSPPDTRSPSPDLGAPADTPEEDSFESGGGGGGGSSNVSAGCNSPLVLTPRQCGSAEPSLLSHLAKWSAAKIADKAEGMSDVSEGPENANYGFRWIPEDDLERQAAEEYCPSKESSREKLADRALPLHRSATGRGTSPASAAAHSPPATTAHGPGPAPPDATATATPTQVRRATSTERSASGVNDESKRKPTFESSVSEQDQISPGIEPGQANTTLVTEEDKHGKTAQRHSKEIEVERTSEISCSVIISDMVTPINSSKGTAPSDKPTRGASLASKVPVSCCRQSFDDMHILPSPANRMTHTKLRLPKMTTVVDLEASLKAMATAASSGGRGAAENAQESLRLSEFQRQGLKNKSFASPVHTTESECQKSDLSKVVLKQQSEILSVLLGVSKRVPTPPISSQKRGITGNTQQRIEAKSFSRGSATKLVLHSNSNVTIPDRFFDWHSQTDPIARQQIEGQRQMRSIRQSSKVDRKLKRLGAIAEGVVPTDRTPRLVPRRVLIGREKGVKRRDEIPGPGWEISEAAPVAGHQLLPGSKSSGSGMCLSRLQNILTDKHGAKDEKWIIGQEKNAVRQESHQAKRRQPRSRKGRHAPVVRLKSSSGNRKSRHHELCMSSVEQPSAPLPANLENDSAAMMGFLTSATGIVKRLVFKTF